ncbi:RidA family protein [soil metagenome]
MSTTEERLKELGLEIPPVPAAAGAYEHCVRSGDLLYLSGGISISHERSILGKVGEGVTLEDGREAARMCLLGRLAVVRDALGSLDAVRRIVAIHGFVNCGPEFTEHPKVIDAASELAIEIFGDAGRHSRTAIGCVSLPLGVAVELGLVVAL